ncbi:MAG TPA: zf-HC2 domain-containing protein [Pyrinomonadaceae bacterium]
MKCEECLPLIEEYVDKELGQSASERIAAHLSTCQACALEAAELEHELEIYARYQRDIAVTPAQWNIVRARIEQEKEQPNGEPRARFREWLSGLFGMGRRFRPALVLALLLIFIGVTAAIIYNARQRGSTELATRPQQHKEAASPQVSPREKRTPEKISDDNQTVARDDNEKNPQRQTVKDNTTGNQREKRTDLAANKRQPASRQTPQQMRQAPDDVAPSFEEAVANSSDVMKGERGSVPAPNGDFDFEIARHAEKAGLLLRSFRNARAASANHALDVSYEREDARRLLYQNISLRRDAEARGDRASATLLNTLEPILLDIAHLPEKARARDVHSIEERMQKKEIVAALQVRALVASN